MFIKTDYSLFSSGRTVEDLVKNCEDVAVLCDDHMFGVLEFVYACRSNNKKPVVGLHKKVGDAFFIFVAKNEIGYKDLMSSESVDNYDELFNNSNVMVILEGYETEENYTADYCINSLSTCADMTSLSIDHIDTKIVNGIEESDIYTLAAINAIGENSDTTSSALEVNFNYEPGNFNSSIFNEIEDYFSFGDPTPPKFKFLEKYAKEYGIFRENITDFDLFKYLCEKGLQDRFADSVVPDNYQERLQFEINIINSMKFPGYMLIVWDFVNYAKEQHIPVGPGRGSAAGSLVAYALKITNIDPMPYNLLFERFLNPERVSFPDIDMDFCRDGREKVIDYVTEVYGQDYVAQVITFGKIAAKSAIKDSARIQRVPLYLAEKIAKMIPEKPGITLSKSLEDNVELKEKIETDFEAKIVWDKAKKIEGFTRNLGVHAAGLIIGSEKIVEKSPTINIKGTHVVQYDGKYLEDVDLVKFDFLGLKTLTMIDYALKTIESNKGIKIDINNISLHDEKVFETISSGNTIGMFQIESDGMRSLNKRLKPNRFEDLVAVLALYRPGPMDSGMLESFVNRKNGKEKVSYFYQEMEEVLKPILEPTYGVIVYQEQVMQIVQTIGGFSLGYADIIRRAMGKKKDMSQYNEEFSIGAEKQGFNKKNASDLFALIEKFAGYGFNKSHSAAYAMITYQTAWLKTYYPVEFMAALINTDIDNTDKVAFYIKEAKRMGIVIHDPDITNSDIEFKVVNDEIFYGLHSVKGVGHSVGHFLKVAKECDYDLNKTIHIMNRNVKKEILSAQKKINALVRKLASTSKKILSFEDKIAKINSATNLTEHKKNLLDKYWASIKELNTLKEELLQSKEEILRKITQLEEEEKSFSYEPLNKRVFEALSSVGALSVFSHTRKCLLENTDNILKMKPIVPVYDEFSKMELLELENKFLEYSISSPFSQEYAFEDTSDTKLVSFLSNEEKTKRDGGKYKVVTLMDRAGEVYKLSDFNGKFNKFSFGDILEVTMSFGKYTNLVKVIKHKVNTKIERGILKINILEDIPSDISSYKEVHIYDAGSVAMVLK